jgi:hypothetical protein
MRTTIRINDHLLIEVKKLALKQNISLSEVIETALKDMLGRRQTYKIKKPVQLPTFKGKGLKHGVDLDDTAALLEFMESK